MVLTSQSKRPPTTHQKKRSGSHQPQTKHYLKTYWPYIPLFAGGALVNVVLDHILGGSTPNTIASVTPTVSRLEWWTGSSQSIVLLVAGIAFLCAVTVVITHARAWQRAVVKGEAFIVRHHTTDLVLATVAMGGFLLTRNILL